MEANKPTVFIAGLIVGVLVCLAAISGYVYLPSYLSSGPQEIPLETALTKIRSNEIGEILINGENARLVDTQKRAYGVRGVESDLLNEQVTLAARDTQTKIQTEPRSTGSGWLFALSVLPFVVLGIAIIIGFYIAARMIIRK